MTEKEQIEIILDRLGELETGYQEWIQPINQLSEKIWRKKDFSIEKIEKEIAQLLKLKIRQYDPYTLIYDELEKLCLSYLSADSQTRKWIRGCVDKLDGPARCLIGYCYKQARLLETTRDDGCLRKGLAAMSIENCRLDYRDSLLALAELYLVGEGAGLNARKYFKAASRWSSAEKPRGGSTSMRSILNNFNEYGVLKEMRKNPKFSQ